MKRMFLSFVLALACIAAVAQDSEFLQKLKALPGVSDITAIRRGPYLEKYELYITQNLDANDPKAGTFKQRLVVGFRGFNKPTVMITGGYSADYALYSYYTEELTEMLEANQVFCEYRYFSKSTPEPCNWDYMTVDNSLADLHNVRVTFGEILKGKWLSTGISKGGSTCTYYRTAYPDDVDASVAYVAPVSKALEDGRHEKFLNKTVGTKADREAMKSVMEELMNRKSRLVPMLDTFCVNRGLKFYIPIDQVYDFEVMELEFSLWQWGKGPNGAPRRVDGDVEWFEYLVAEVEPDYFAYPNSTLPFFYQTLREFGYYGYDYKKLGKNASIKSSKDYVKWVMVPEEMRDVKFSKDLYKRTCAYLKKNDPTHIFIYGANDPWTASGVAPWLDCSKKKNMKIYVQPGGSHLARIGNMPAQTKKEIIARVMGWMR